jgi:hypothetical protein
MREGNFRGSWKHLLAKQMPSSDVAELAEFKMACVFIFLPNTAMTNL